jgi:O-antigen ligase
MNVKICFWWAFLLFVFTIPISQFVSVRLLLLLLFVSFFTKTKENNSFSFLKNSWDILVYISMLAIGLIYSQDLNTGLAVMETNFSFLAVPVVISRCPVIDRVKLNEVFRAFKIGLLVAALICLCFATYQYIQKPDIQLFFFYKFTDVINSHPTYFAYYIIFAISVELFSVYYDKARYPIILKYFTILFLFLILILTGGQTAFIGILFVLSFFILKFLIEEKTIKKKIAVGFVVLMLSCMFLISMIVKEVPLKDLNDSWERAVLWDSAISAINNLFLGVGTGDYRIALNEYYLNHGLARFANESYNAHNQGIQILFSNGLLGLFSFGIMIIRPLFLAIQYKNILTILCFFPFLVYGVTEAFLGRYQGVVFFALLHQVFILTMQTEKSFSAD